MSDWQQPGFLASFPEQRAFSSHELEPIMLWMGLALAASRFGPGRSAVGAGARRRGSTAAMGSGDDCAV